MIVLSQCSPKFQNGAWSLLLSGATEEVSDNKQIYGLFERTHLPSLKMCGMKQVFEVLVGLVVKMGDSVLCWSEGLAFVPQAGQSMWYGVRGLSLTTH